ncbi:MAG: hypothetical protein GEU71_15060 [Actinobacteria bacterium]|nr:hypothetical protein [Actinomycetota bacterium]
MNIDITEAALERAVTLLQKFIENDLERVDPADAPVMMERLAKIQSICNARIAELTEHISARGGAE